MKQFMNIAKSRLSVLFNFFYHIYKQEVKLSLMWVSYQYEVAQLLTQYVSDVSNRPCLESDCFGLQFEHFVGEIFSLQTTF